MNIHTLNQYRKAEIERKKWEFIFVEAAGAILVSFLAAQYALHFLVSQVTLH